MEYEKLNKNTVKAENQLEKSRFMTFLNSSHQGLRVMFVGNSITLHGISHDIGWYNECGMAASSPEKDYVHLCISHILEKYTDATFCICQAAEWERRFLEGDATYSLYENARNFNADVIVVRLVENCPQTGYEEEEFIAQYGNFINYLNKSGEAEVIVTTGFWKHPAGRYIISYAKREALPLVELEDLGEKEEMKAIGLFEHMGVANHPGDLGMEYIAKRITDVFDKVVNRIPG